MFAKTLLAGVGALTCLGSACPSFAAADVWVRVAPPAPRVEVVPAPRHGYQWVRGHWQWQHKHYVWHNGTWVRERRGYVYNQPTWVERDGRWHMAAGNWARHDSDHDGVRNGADRRPDDPTRR